MNELEQVRKRLRLMNIKAVADGAGVHVNVVYRMAHGHTRPRYETVRRVADYLRQQGMMCDG